MWAAEKCAVDHRMPAAPKARSRASRIRVTHHAPSAWLYDGPPNRAEHIVKPPLGTAPLGLALVAQQRGRKADEP